VGALCVNGWKCGVVHRGGDDRPVGILFAFPEAVRNVRHNTAKCRTSHQGNDLNNMLESHLVFLQE
jgi:hypothetical protein